jgi:hypothetical protein
MIRMVEVLMSTFSIFSCVNRFRENSRSQPMLAHRLGQQFCRSAPVYFLAGNSSGSY